MTTSLIFEFFERKEFEKKCSRNYTLKYVGIKGISFLSRENSVSKEKTEDIYQFYLQEKEVSCWLSNYSGHPQRFLQLASLLYPL